MPLEINTLKARQVAKTTRELEAMNRDTERMERENRNTMRQMHRDLKDYAANKPATAALLAKIEAESPWILTPDEVEQRQGGIPL